MASRQLVRATVSALALLALAGTTTRASEAPPDLAMLLDEYTSGDGSRAIRRVEQLDDEAAIDMRLDWATVGRIWIDREPTNRPRRLFAAAAFALETEVIRVERGQWSRSASRKIKVDGKERTIHCNGACVLAWARGLFVERGAPDAAEHAWWMATIALAQGVRDTRFLLPTVPASFSPAFIAAAKLDPSAFPPDTTTGHLDAGLLRFPNDPAMRLASAVALAARYEIITAAAPRSPAAGTGSGDLTLERVVTFSTTRGPGGTTTLPAGPTSAQVNRNRYAQLPPVVSEFEAIVNDPAATMEVRTEARIRLGYLHWATGDNVRAVGALNLAAESAPDADSRYLARYLVGNVLESAGDVAGAIKAYEAALEARPHSQSASIKLAVLRQLRGDAAGAQTLAQESLDARPSDADPWRLILYGHYPEFPALLGEVRRKVTR